MFYQDEVTWSKLISFQEQMAFFRQYVIYWGKTTTRTRTTTTKNSKMMKGLPWLYMSSYMPSSPRMTHIPFLHFEIL